MPVGVPKTGLMIESMVTATAANVAALIAGRKPQAVATWNQGLLDITLTEDERNGRRRGGDRPISSTVLG